MRPRPAARAWERMLGVDGPEDLWTSRDAVRGDVLEALRHVTDAGGPWRSALLATARRRGFTPAYIVDRALVLRAALAAHGEPDLYAILGVSPDAAPDAIRRRWRLLAKQHHPDADGRRQAETFRRVHAAYAVLGNAVERVRYDARFTRHPVRLQIDAPGPSPDKHAGRAAGRVPHVAAAAVAIAVIARLASLPASSPEVAAPTPADPVAVAPVVGPPAPIAVASRRPRRVRPVSRRAAPPELPVAPPAVVPAVVALSPPPARPAVVAGAARPPGRGRAPAIDRVAAREFLDEFGRRYAAGEAIGLLQLFASNGAANGRRGVEIAEAYDEFFRRLHPSYTTGRIEVRATRGGATVESELVLTAYGRSPMRGVAYWDLVREGGRVRVARLVSSLPAL